MKRRRSGPVLRISLRLRRSHLLTWGLSLFAFMFLIGSSYAAVAENEEYDAIWESLPEEAREAFGGAGSLTAVDGYLDSQAVAYLPILLTIGTALLLTRSFAGAEESGALDHALARPVTRTRYFWAQVGAAGIIGVSNILASVAGAVAGFALAGVSGNELLRAAGMIIEVVPIYAALIALATLVAVSFHRRGPASGVAVGGLFGLFVIDLLSRLVPDVDWLRYATPYGYWHRSDLYHGELDLVYLAVSAGLAIGAVLLAWRVFDRKDLYA